MSPKLDESAEAWSLWSSQSVPGFYWVWHSGTTKPFEGALCKDLGTLHLLDGQKMYGPVEAVFLLPWLPAPPKPPELKPAPGEWSHRPWEGGLYQVQLTSGERCVLDVFVLANPKADWKLWAVCEIDLEAPDLFRIGYRRVEDLGPSRWCRYQAPEMP